MHIVDVNSWSDSRVHIYKNVVRAFCKMPARTLEGYFIVVDVNSYVGKPSSHLQNVAKSHGTHRGVDTFWRVLERICLMLPSRRPM